MGGLPVSAMGRHKKSKAAKRRSSRGKAPRPMYVMMPPAVPGHCARASSSSSSSSSSDSSSSHGQCKLLHRGATWVLKLPKTRLQQVVEALDSTFDSVLTAELEGPDLCRILWIFARTKPQTRVVALRAKTYKDLCERFKTAALRMKRGMGDEAGQAQIRDLFPMTPEKIQAVAAQAGFQDEWLRPAKRKAQEEGTQLPLRFQGPQAAQQGALASTQGHAGSTFLFFRGHRPAGRPRPRLYVTLLRGSREASREAKPSLVERGQRRSEAFSCGSRLSDAGGLRPAGEQQRLVS